MRCGPCYVAALWIGVLIPGAVATPAAQTGETSLQKHVIAVERIWDRAGHNAFTDLATFQGSLYCTFREGSGHIPGLNGSVRIIRSKDGMNWESVDLLEEAHVDLRDPKLAVTPDGRLMVLSGASFYHGEYRKRIESRVAFFDPSRNAFSPPQKVIFPPALVTGFNWLWRVTWHDGWAWGFAMEMSPKGRRQFHLLRSRDGVVYEHVATPDLERANETTLRFLPDRTLIAMVRGAGGKQKGWIGKAQPPYTDWSFTLAEIPFGGPNIIQLPDGSWLAASRGYENAVTTTDLLRASIETARFERILSLPSGGDTSYPGFVIDRERNRLLVSYYSSHEHGTAIYLATLRLEALMMK